ncbi:MAG: hypothetical protein L3J56_11690 [Bacteroidales bacterium]|nr:hypothetical protein [Bacteroidales bacterium]
METINRHNYGAYFLDYSEGNLSESNKQELIRFLAKNPSLKEELNNFEELKLTPSHIKFTKKEELIKKTRAQHFEITEFEYLCVASIENDINESEKKQLKKELKNIKKQKAFEIFSEIKLQANSDIQYLSKDVLRKKYFALKYSTIISIASAAAVLLFLIFSRNFFLNNNFENRTVPIAYDLSNKNRVNTFLNNNKTNLYDKNHTQQEQASVIHNQTIKNSANNVLAFEDSEPRSNTDLYKELTVSIPEIKSGALISNINNNISINYIPATIAVNYDGLQRNKNDQLWKYAEKGVHIWKKLTNDDIELKNEYAENGSINEVNFIASNFQFRKTFNRK